MALDAVSYRDEYQRSISDPEGFWLEAATAVDWAVAPRQAHNGEQPPHGRWFADGELNTCYNALDRHIAAGRGDLPALIHDSAMTGTQRVYTYAELTDQVARFAGVLRAQGVGKGDRVLIYMPMIPEAAIAMLATARLGAIHSVVFGGFAASELAVRIQDAAPTVVVTTSGGLEPHRLVEYLPTVHEALGKAGVPELPVVIKHRDGFAADPAALGLNAVDWESALAAAEPAAPVPVKASDPLYILYTSGTTGAPKGWCAITVGTPSHFCGP